MDMYASTTISETPHSSGVPSVKSAIHGADIRSVNNGKSTCRKRGRPRERAEERMQEQRSNKKTRLELNRWIAEAEQMHRHFLDEFKEQVEQHITETRAWVSDFHLCLDEFKEQVEQDSRVLISAMREKINDMFCGLKQGFCNDHSLSLSLGTAPVQAKEDKRARDYLMRTHLQFHSIPHLE